MEKYPIPTHLVNILKVNEKHSDLRTINGRIICNCGCEKFRIMQNEDREYDSTLPYGEEDGMKITAVCEDCRKTMLLFDEATQGYNGFVCHDCKTAKDESLSLLKCKKCGEHAFKVIMGIEAEDQEQFIEECVEESPEEFVPEDFVNAFNWITVTVQCTSCCSEDEWVSLELS